MNLVLFWPVTRLDGSFLARDWPTTMTGAKYDPVRGKNAPGAFLARDWGKTVTGTTYEVRVTSMVVLGRGTAEMTREFRKNS